MIAYLDGGGADPLFGGRDPGGGGADPLFGGRDPDGGGADPLFGGRDPDDGGGALSLPFGGGSAEPKSKKFKSNLTQSTNL